MKASNYYHEARIINECNPTKIIELPARGGAVHESVLRSYQILKRVKEMLNADVPVDIVLEFIDVAEGR